MNTVPNSSSITLDLIAQTASNSTTISGNLITNMSMANNQIIFEIRGGFSLSPADFKLAITNQNNFQSSLQLNFPILSQNAAASIASSMYTLSCNIFPHTTTISYLYQVRGGPGPVQDIINASYDTITKLVTITPRTAAITAPFSSFVFNQTMTNRFLQEIYNN